MSDFSLLSPSLRVLQSTQLVLDSAVHVKLPDQDVYLKVAHQILDGMTKHKYSPSTWRQHPLHPSEANDHAAEFIFLLDLLNFSFWSDDPSNPFTVKYQGKQYTGYWSLVAALRRALDEGISITNAHTMRSMTHDTLSHVFRSETSTQIPLFEERLSCIRHAGDILVQHFDGSFVNLIRQANGSSQSLIEQVLVHFPSFRDEAMYQHHRVYFYKRVQILVADLWACFECQDLGEINDMDQLTMFADYRVPQALVYLGLIHYSPSLLDDLHRGVPLVNGDVREIEIRAASIWAVEHLRSHVNGLIGLRGLTSQFSHVNAVLLDFYLWDMAKQQTDDMIDIPIHHTRSIFY